MKVEIEVEQMQEHAIRHPSDRVMTDFGEDRVSQLVEERGSSPCDTI